MVQIDKEIHWTISHFLPLDRRNQQIRQSSNIASPWQASKSILTPSYTRKSLQLYSIRNESVDLSDPTIKKHSDYDTRFTLEKVRSILLT